MSASILTHAMIGLSIVCLSNCTPDFESAAVILDSRIINVQADPPEIFVTNIIQPNADPVNVTVLVAAKDGFATPYTWEVVACTAEKVGQNGGCANATYSEAIASGSSTDETFSATFEASTTLILKALEADPFFGFGGIPVLVEARIEGLSSDTETALDDPAFKRVVYSIDLPCPPNNTAAPTPATTPAPSSGTPATLPIPVCLPLPPGKTPNSNPAIDTIAFEVEDIIGLDDSTDAESTPSQNNQPGQIGSESITVESDPPQSFAPLSVLKINPIPIPGSDEDYIVLTANNNFQQDSNLSGTNSTTLKEYLDYVFYVTGGQIQFPRTGGAPSELFGNRTEEAGELPPVDNTWTLPKDPGTYHLWVIVSDGRGGNAWTKRTVVVAKPPETSPES